MKEQDHKSQRRGGLYFSGENPPYITVTTALGIIEKPALQHWFGKQVWSAMIADPTLSWEQARQKPYETRDRAASRGSTVHSIIEAIKAGAEMDEISPKYQGYLDAFKQWMSDYSVEIVEQEKTIYHEEEGYAGTLDLLAKVNNNELITVVDVKTGKAIYPEAFLQIAAYREAVEIAGTETNGAGVLLLKPRGGYAYEYTPDTERKYEGFLAAKTLYEAINEEQLMKTGYFETWGGEEK